MNDKRSSISMHLFALQWLLSVHLLSLVPPGHPDPSHTPLSYVSLALESLTSPPKAVQCPDLGHPVVVMFANVFWGQLANRYFLLAGCTSFLRSSSSLSIKDSNHETNKHFRTKTSQKMRRPPRPLPCSASVSCAGARQSRPNHAPALRKEFLGGIGRTLSSIGCGRAGTSKVSACFGTDLSDRPWHNRPECMLIGAM